MKVLLIDNPSSGSADGEALVEVAMTLEKLGRVRRCTPNGVDSFEEEVAAASAEAEIVVVAGGDGTLNGVLQLLGPRLGDVTLGLIPMGTGNDLARSLSLPADPRAAAWVVSEGSARTIDLGRARGPGVERLFLNACMGGFPVDVDRAVDDDLKRRLGPIAFWLAGVRAATALERSTVTIDGAEMPGCVAVGVGNGRTCGGGLEVWPAARPDDGMLDACAMRAEKLPEALRLAVAVRDGRHVHLDTVATSTGPSIAVDADPQIEFNVDGELPGLHTPATFEVVGKVRMIVPSS